MPAVAVLAGVAETARGAQANKGAQPPPTGSYSCVAAPANPPTPPPLPPSAMSDRQAVGLVNARPLCPGGEVALAMAFPGPGFNHGIDSTAVAESQVSPAHTKAAHTNGAQPPYTIQTNGTNTCPNYAPPGFPASYYCHDIEDETGTNAIGLYVSMEQDGPYVQSGDYGHSISQLWGLQGSGSSTRTLETGWIVDPASTKDNLPHLFEFHTGDDYANPTNSPNIDCYNACGFVGVSGSPVAVGETLPTNHSQGDFGVLLSGGYWWFYYGGYYYGYISQTDPSWVGNPVTAITEAQAGGEIDSTVSNCPVTAMGNDTFGSASSGALIGGASLIPPNGNFFPPTYLTPQTYAEEESTCMTSALSIRPKGRSGTAGPDAFEVADR